MADPLELVADEIADESILLCVDEFMVCFYCLVCVINVGR